MIHALSRDQAWNLANHIKRDVPNVRIKKQANCPTWQKYWFDDTQLTPSTREKVLGIVLTHLGRISHG